jgi:hypothetical protein
MLDSATDNQILHKYALSPSAQIAHVQEYCTPVRVLKFAQKYDDLFHMHEVRVLKLAINIIIVCTESVSFTHKIIACT